MLQIVANLQILPQPTPDLYHLETPNIALGDGHFLVLNVYNA
ncbi:hypothetical protein [Scytonema hofmannii]|nr:hypothetical protein [Scytonema hofmannii]